MDTTEDPKTILPQDFRRMRHDISNMRSSLQSSLHNFDAELSTVAEFREDMCDLLKLMNKCLESIQR